jgi:hypothetical protein
MFFCFLTVKEGFGWCYGAVNVWSGILVNGSVVCGGCGIAMGGHFEKSLGS